jgi:uncharacterized protein YjcR
VTRREDELLDVREFAEMFGVKPSAVWQWRQRGIRPEPDAVKNGLPLWRRRTLQRWGRDTGRLPAEEQQG